MSRFFHREADPFILDPLPDNGSGAESADNVATFVNLHAAHDDQAARPDRRFDLCSGADQQRAGEIRRQHIDNACMDRQR